MLASDHLVIAGKTFQSRLIIGTGKYPSHAVMAKAHEASGADMVTVAVRRVNISDRSKESLLDYIDTSKMFLLPNTAGCYSADEAVRTARLATSAPCFPTTNSLSRPRAFWSATASSCFLTRPTIRSSAASSKMRARRR